MHAPEVIIYSLFFKILQNEYWSLMLFWAFFRKNTGTGVYSKENILRNSEKKRNWLDGKNQGV